MRDAFSQRPEPPVLPATSSLPPELPKQPSLMAPRTVIFRTACVLLLCVGLGTCIFVVPTLARDSRWKQYARDRTPPVQEFSINESRFNLVFAVSPDGQRALYGSTSSSTITLIDLRDGTVLMTFGGDWDSTQCLAFSPDGRKALSGADDGVVRLWNLDDGQEIGSTPSRGTWIRSVAFSPLGDFAVSGGDEKEVTLWRLDNMTAERHFVGNWIHGHYGLTFMPGEKKVVSGSWDGSVRIWEIESGNQVADFNPSLGRVLWVAISPDGKFGLSGYLEGGKIDSSPPYHSNGGSPIILWDPTTGREINRFSVPGSPWDADRSLNAECAAFSPNGKTAIFGFAFGSVIYWDIENWREIAHNALFEWDIVSVTFSPDGTRALAVGDDVRYSGDTSALRAWQLPSAASIKTD